MNRGGPIAHETPVAASSVGAAGFDVRLVPDALVESTVLPLWLKGMSDVAIVNHVDERFKWLYDRNPTGRALSWVVVDRQSQEALGSCSVVPHRMHIHGLAVCAGLLVDFIVDPKARTAGPAIALQRGIADQSAAHGFDLLFGYPNQKAWPILARAGYKAFGGTRLWARSLLADPPRVERWIESRLRSILPGTLARTLATRVAWPAAWIFQAGSLLVETAHLTRHRDLAGHLQRFCGDAPQLERPSHTELRTDDSPEYLRWRFATHPTHDYRLFGLHDGSDCVAWAVIRIYADSAEIQAVQWTRDRADLPAALWWHLAHAVRKEGIPILSVNLAGSAQVENTLSESLFVDRHEDRKVILRAVNPDTATLLDSLPLLAAGGNWQLYAGTLDI